MAGGASSKPRQSFAKVEEELLFHDIGQTLRISGIDPIFPVWPLPSRMFQLIWPAVKPNAETYAFEHAADRLRNLAVTYSSRMGRLDAASEARLGESQSWQVRAALDLYHYLHPKLLLLASSIRLALLVEGPPGFPNRSPRLIQRGVPAGMYPMEILPEGLDGPRLAEVFNEINAESGAHSTHACYRTLGLWPDYLMAAWKRLRQFVRRIEYDYACDRLREESRGMAISLPLPIHLTPEEIRGAGDDPLIVLRTMEEAEQALSSLMLNIALMSLDWKTPQLLAVSPFPVGER